MAEQSTVNLPNSEQLERLQRSGRVAYAARCAMRVLPCVVAKYNVQRWGRNAAQHLEAIARAVQATYWAACTARADYLMTARKAAIAAAQSATGAAAAAARSAAAAAAARDAASAEAAARFSCSAAYFAAGAGGETAAAAQADFDTLSRIDSAEGVGVDFFRHPLWPDGEPEGWGEIRVAWAEAMRRHSLESLAERMNEHGRGDLDLTAIEQDLGTWTQKVDALMTGTRDDLKNESTDDGAAVPLIHRRVYESQTIIGGDGRAEKDTLGRAKLARVLADFIADRRTAPPLTLSIEGRWGSGKTTFMGLLQDDLVKVASTPGRIGIRTVWFNPWRCQSHEELWAAFALTVLRELRAQLRWPTRLWRQARYDFLALDHDAWLRSALHSMLSVFVTAIVGVFVWEVGRSGWDWTKLAMEVGDPGFWWRLLGVPATLAGPILLAGKAIWTLWKQAEGRLTWRLKVHLKRPDYAARTSFLEEFHDDFAHVVRAYAGENERVVAFIDDLDRCDVPMAADLMRGLNLMISERVPMVFVLGLDRAKVAAGLAVKHEDLLPYLWAQQLGGMTEDESRAALRAHGLEYGYEFVEKFIQLPFRLPPPTTDELAEFLRQKLHRDTPDDVAAPPRLPVDGVPSARDESNVTTPSEDRKPSNEPGAYPNAVDGDNGSAPELAQQFPSYDVEIVADETPLEKPLLHAAKVLEGNPRRVNQLINLVRLQQRLSKAQHLDLSVGHIAKWTAISLRWPRFILELTEIDPANRRQLLQDLVSDQHPEHPSILYLRWDRVRSLVDFLREIAPGQPVEQRAKGIDFAKLAILRSTFHTERKQRGEISYDLTETGVLDNLLRLAIAVPVAEATAGGGVKPTAEAPSTLTGDTTKSGP